MRCMGLALALAAVSAVVVHAADETGATRVFVGEKDSSEISGGVGPSSANAVRFGKRCPQFTVTLDQDKADYVVLLESEGVATPIQKGYKFAVFGGDGDMMAGGATRTLKNAVKDACEVIEKSLRAKKR